MQEIEYLMESDEEAFRLDIKTDSTVVKKQALWAGIRPGMRVADICCGSGKTTFMLHKLIQPSGIAVGVDGSEKRIKYAKAHYSVDGIEYKCRDIRKPLDELGIFDLSDTSTDISKAMGFTNLILNLTSGCNFDCVYCFRDSSTTQTMNLETYRKAVDLIPKYFNKERCNLTFFGGEPLLLYPRFKQMVEYAEKILSGRRLSLSMTTNGSLLDNEKIRFLAEKNFNVIVSLDSFASINHLTRRPKRGCSEEVYTTIISNIQTMIHSGVNTACNIVVTQMNINSLHDFITHLIEMGIKKISYSLVSNKEYWLSPSAREQLIIEEKKITEFLLQNPSINVEPLSALVNLIRTHKLHLYKCGYGRLRIDIQPNGDITPCQRVFRRMGNVNEGIDLEISKQIALDAVNNRPVCNQCHYRYLCGGNCYHESLTHEGNPHKPYTPFCDHFTQRVKAVSEKMITYCTPIVSIDGLKVL